VNLDGDPLAVPWRPEGLPSVTDVDEFRERWRYVVVEEVAGGTAELHSWPWPMVDQTGRLAWLDDDEDAVEVGVVPRDVLRDRLYRPDLRRVPRAGDTFAARLSPDTERPRTDDPLLALLGTEVYDISPDARLAAKVGYLGSTTAIIHDEAAAADLLAEAQSAREAEQPAVQLELTPDVRAGGDGGGASGGDGAVGRPR
jgi:hypothetical protein